MNSHVEIMKYNPGLLGVTTLLLILTIASCATSIKEVYPTLTDGKYDSEFPYRSCSDQLAEISESVMMVSSIAFYKNYIFSEASKTRLSDITEELLRKKSHEVVLFNQSSSGTATVIHRRERTVALLTCAHVVVFQDTSVWYYSTSTGERTPYVRSISIKEKQTNYVGAFPEGGEVEVILIDKDLDIALIGKKFQSIPQRIIPVFGYPTGRAKELEWGSFVYLLGFPSGYKILTKAIVSSPNKDRKGTFLVDAVFSGGFSGGVVLAIRDGVPNFELVGIVRLVSAHFDYFLTPKKGDNTVEYDPVVPYGGDIYVERKSNIEYGIAQAIPIEEIRNLIDGHEDDLLRQGYDLASFIRQPRGD
jgi:hypothetical protein